MVKKLRKIPKEKVHRRKASITLFSPRRLPWKKPITIAGPFLLYKHDTGPLRFLNSKLSVQIPWNNLNNDIHK
jgi:hypothetical protein